MLLRRHLKQLFFFFFFSFVKPCLFGTGSYPKKTCFIPNDNSTKQSLFNLKTPAALLLIAIQQSRYHFCADLSHAQVFGDNLSNSILSRLTCNHSNSQRLTSTHQLPYLFNVDRSPVCWRPPAPVVIMLYN